MMILLWSRWNCIKTLNFKPFPEETPKLVLVQVDPVWCVPRAPCVSTECVPHWTCMCRAHTHTRHGLVNTLQPHPLCPVAQLHITKFFARKTYLKGWWSIWVVLWVFTPQFLPLIRQTPHQILLRRLKGLGEARPENLAVFILGLCLWTQGGLNVIMRLWNQCLRYASNTYHYGLDLMFPF